MDHVAEIAELRAANKTLTNRVASLLTVILSILRDGDGFRPKTSSQYPFHKLQQCEHGRFRYEGCLQCMDISLERLLENDKMIANSQ